MPPLTFRLRHSGGQATLPDIPEDATVADLKELVSQKTGIAAARQLLKVAGTPPTALPQDDVTKRLTDVGCRNRDTIIVEDGLAAEIAALAAKHDLPAATPSDKVQKIERHVVPSDNSCLFTSVAYLTRGQQAAAPTPTQELRRLVANEIAGNPERWDMVTQAEAQKAYLDYTEWICRSESWGGSIELMVLAEKLGVQLSAVDIKSLRVDNYPHEGPYKHRAYVLYDGIHYDAVIGCSGPGDAEVRIFDPADDTTLSKVMGLAAELQQLKQFTDTANFTLQCQQCFALLTGEAEAQKHGNETGHFNFQEVGAAR
mmetsp:Transcript_55091/g.131283  ORF Transcript_55091/g.131283 Transcript_55091/m.131283 type:complete len:314 (+) Transcript_55091:80-1021(+)